MYFSPSCVVGAELFAQGGVSACGVEIEEGVELRAVVFVDGVAELVDDDIVDEVVGQAHEVYTERNVVACRTAAPFAHRIADRDAVVTETERTRYFGSPVRQESLGFYTPCFLDTFFDRFLNVFACEEQSGRVSDGYPALGYAYADIWDIGPAQLQ